MASEVSSSLIHPASERLQVQLAGFFLHSALEPLEPLRPERGAQPEYARCDALAFCVEEYLRRRFRGKLSNECADEVLSEIKAPRVVADDLQKTQFEEVKNCRLWWALVLLSQHPGREAIERGKREAEGKEVKAERT